MHILETGELNNTKLNTNTVHLNTVKQTQYHSFDLLLNDQ